MSDAGSWLQERREELHLSRSGVERLTSESANKAADERYRIRRGRLTDLEAGRSAPDIFEVASLCECYKVTYPAVLQAFGMKSGESGSTPESPTKADATSKQWSHTDAGRPSLGNAWVKPSLMGEEGNRPLLSCGFCLRSGPSASVLPWLRRNAERTAYAQVCAHQIPSLGCSKKRSLRCNISVPRPLLWPVNL